MADFWTQYESSRSGRKRGTAKRFYGERVCSILNADVDNLASNYDPALGATGTWPGASGTFAAQLREYRLEPDTAGRKKLTLIYREPTPEEALTPGRAVLYVSLAGSAQKLLREWAGLPGALNRVIEGPVDDKPLQKWVVVEGGNTTLVPGAVLRVRTVAQSAALPVMWGLIGKYNESELPNFMHAPARVLRFLGCKLGGTLIDRQYWMLDYLFDYDPNGWDKKCKSQKFKKVVVNLAAVDADNAALVGGPRNIIGWVEEGVPEDRDVSRGPGNFSYLNGMLGWY